MGTWIGEVLVALLGAVLLAVQRHRETARAKTNERRVEDLEYAIEAERHRSELLRRDLLAEWLRNLPPSDASISLPAAEVPREPKANPVRHDDDGGEE